MTLFGKAGLYTIIGMVSDESSLYWLTTGRFVASKRRKSQQAGGFMMRKKVYSDILPHFVHCSPKNLTQRFAIPKPFPLENLKRTGFFSWKSSIEEHPLVE
jgi:hypothetical protein